MKSKEILTSAKTELSVQLESIGNQFKADIDTRLDELFSEIQFPVDVRFDKRFSVYRTGYVGINISDGTIYKEIGTIWYADKYHWDSNESKVEAEVSLNYYTTTMDFRTSFEATRLKVLGEIAWFIDNNKEQVLNVWTETYAKYDEAIKSINNKIGEIDYTIRQIDEAERVALRDKFYSELNTDSGVTFNKNLFLSIRNGYKPKITNLRVINFSSSGKTANIEYTGVSGTVYTDTIRVKNLEDFFSENRTEVSEVISV